MRPKFVNCSFSMREVIITSILQGFDRKNHFFDGWSWFKFNNLGWVGSSYQLEILHQCVKRVRTKSQKVFRVNWIGSYGFSSFRMHLVAVIINCFFVFSLFTHNLLRLCMFVNYVISVGGIYYFISFVVIDIVHGES